MIRQVSVQSWFEGPVMPALFGLVFAGLRIRGIVSGSITVSGWKGYPTIERAAQPLQFRVVMAGYGVVTAICLWIAAGIIGNDGRDLCLDIQQRLDPRTVVAACNELLRAKDGGDDGHGWLRAARGIAFHRAGSLDKAVADYDEALQLDPADFRTLDNRALIFARRGQYRAALNDLSAAVRLQPDDYDVRMHRGQILLQSGRPADALKDFSRALDTMPQDELAMACGKLAAGSFNQPPGSPLRLDAHGCVISSRPRVQSGFR